MMPSKPSDDQAPANKLGMPSERFATTDPFHRFEFGHIFVVALAALAVYSWFLWRF